MPKILAVILEIVLTVAFFWLLIFLSTLLHELGHALGYRLATGDREWRVVMGKGKNLFRTKRVTVNLIIPFGCMYPVEDKADTRGKRIATSLGGPLVSLLLTILFFILRSKDFPVIESEIFLPDTLKRILDFAFFYNLIQLISTAIPIRYPYWPYQGMKSDGLNILEALKNAPATPVSVLRKLSEKDFVTTHWKGGTTTQFLIFPREADYGDRDFLWRISSAAVEKPQSSFTPLPGYERWITPLTGPLSLQIDGGEEQLLNPYQILSFDGASDTRGRGLCTDFNLMIRQGQALGRMETMQLDQDPRSLPLLEDARDILLFCPEADCTIQFPGGETSLPAGQALLAENGGGLGLSARSEGPARLLLAQAGPANSQ